MRHTRARNIIERAFAVLKMRWGILRSACYYPVKIQTQLILACFLLHNYCRTAMPVDPLDQTTDVYDDQTAAEPDDPNVQGEYIDSVEPSNAWTQMREDLAGSMWDEVLAILVSKRCPISVLFQQCANPPYIFPTYAVCGTPYMTARRHRDRKHTSF